MVYISGGKEERADAVEGNQCDVTFGTDAHHCKHSFVDELRELPNEAGIEFDEKYLW